MQGGLTRADGQGFDSAFEQRDSPLEHRVGWVANSAIAVAVGLQIEECGGMFRTIEFVGDGLIDRHGNSASVAIYGATAMYCNRLRVH